MAGIERIIEGNDSLAVLRNQSLRAVIMSATQIAGSRFERFIEPEINTYRDHRQSYDGHSLILTRFEGSQFGITIDTIGSAIIFACLNKNPRRLLVISGTKPAMVDLDSESWIGHVTNAVVSAVRKPARWTDLEMQLGTIVQAVWPDLQELGLI